MITAVTEYITKPSGEGGAGRLNKYLPYDKTLTTRAKELRNNMTIAKKKLRYDFLKDNKYKFTRQKPIDKYIVDFYSSKLGLVIEVDGDTHRSQNEISYDHQRTKDLENFGLKIMRFTNDEVLLNFEEVCDIIKKNNPSHLPLSGEQNIINHGNNILLDIGTGCGVLGISVLLQNPNFFSKSIFTDFYANAIEVAKQNYKHLIINPESETDFIQSDLLDFIQNLNFDIKNFNITLVANLPYIPEKTFDDNSPDNVQKREPKPAFVGGEDGLIYYYKMLDQILDLKLNKLIMFLEMMTRQIDILRSRYGDYFVFEEVKTFHFNIRILKVTCK
ncbi:DUF559 domain-containing protein [Candidatus Gracilibacteria bacterium]|nr:DUF559 domain-containing protein [Candidatus Gracilibacteria bacterium]